jgi:competence protein ComEC
MPLLWLSLAFISGILLADTVKLAAWGWLALAGCIFLLGLLAHRTPGAFQVPLRLGQRLFVTLPAGLRASLLRLRDQFRNLGFQRSWRPLPTFLLLVACLSGAARYQLSQPRFSPSFIAWYNDRQIPLVIEGVIREFPDEQDNYTQIRMQADRLRTKGELLFTPVEGWLLARLPPGDWRYGDRVRLEGWLETPPILDDFSYREYLARQGIYSWVPNAQAHILVRDQGNPLLTRLYNARESARSTLNRLYPEPEASLLAGILLGIESGIPQAVQEAFNATGTSHIIVISGFNISLLAAFFIPITARMLGRWRGAIAAVVIILGYAVLVGANPPVIRAAIFGVLAIFANLLGRRQNAQNSLAFAAALMALFEPQILWEIGFQLSFAATLGLVIYAEPLAAAFERLSSRLFPQAAFTRLARPVQEYVLLTFAAQLATLPIMLFYFQQLSLSALVANPLILPVQPPVMILGGISLLLGMLFQPLGQAVAYLAWPCVAYTLRIVEWLAQIPGGTLALGPVSPFWILFLCGVIFLPAFAGRQLRALAGWLAPAWKPGLGLAGIGLVAVLAWQVGLAAPDGNLHLTILDVGSGDALLIQTPTGRYLLVDGGPSASRLSTALGRHLPLTNRRLDWLVVAAPGPKNLDALPRNLARFPVEQVLWAGPTHGSYASRQLWEFLTGQTTPVTRAEAGQALDLGQGARLEVLAVSGRGAVLLLEWASFRALLPLGIDFESLERLQAGQSPSQVSALLLAESGYAPANPQQWLEQLRPQIVLLSVAADDFNGLPSPETLEALEGYSLLRTDRNGWIELITDGKQMWVQVER